MRRLHLPQLQTGQILLDPSQAHHARDVLRLGEGDAVEVFDDAGRTARATIIRCSATEVLLEVADLAPPPAALLDWTIASAVPKGQRADWMIEKLSELGASAFVPLAAARSVVLPEGRGKKDRWIRLASESAKQSRRPGVMRIDDLTDVRRLIAGLKGPAWYFSTEPSAIPATEAIRRLATQPAPPSSLALLIGPEGGWAPEELSDFAAAGLTPVSLGATILRVETAAVAAAAIVAAVLIPSLRRPGDATPAESES